MNLKQLLSIIILCLLSHNTSDALFRRCTFHHRTYRKKPLVRRQIRLTDNVQKGFESQDNHFLDEDDCILSARKDALVPSNSTKELVLDPRLQEDLALVSRYTFMPDIIDQEAIDALFERSYQKGNDEAFGLIFHDQELLKHVSPFIIQRVFYATMQKHDLLYLKRCVETPHIVFNLSVEDLLRAQKYCRNIVLGSCEGSFDDKDRRLALYILSTIDQVKIFEEMAQDAINGLDPEL